MSAGRKHTSKKVKHETGGAKRYLFFLIPLVLAVVVLGYVTIQPAASIGIGSIAPDFKLQVVGPDGLTGETMQLSSFRGSVVLLEFMESWCKNCRAVAPAIESLRWDYEPRGVVFISVAGTDRGASAESTAAFIKESSTSWAYVLDSDNGVFHAYDVSATPTFFILDRNGVIDNVYTGIATTVVLTSALDAALAG